MAPDFPSGDTASAHDDALVFVSDSSAEAERLTSALRSRGYAVVDVPLTMLVGRVAVQKPALILCDIDAPGALEQIKRLRDVPFGGRVDIIFLGESGRTLDQQKDEVFHESSGFFVRPVDTFVLLRKVEALIGAPAHPAPGIQSAVSSRPPASLPASRPPGAVVQPSAPSHVSISSSAPPEPAAPAGSEAVTTPPPPRRTASPAPSSAPSSAPRRASPVPSGHPDSVLPQPIPLGFAHAAAPLAQHIPQSEISAELESILARAEQRVGALAKGSPAPPPRMSPEQEVDAVLPAEVLAALDEPLDSDEQDESSSGTGHGSESAGTGGSARTGMGTGGGSMSGGTGSRHLSQARADTAPPPRRGLDDESNVPDEVEPPPTPPAGQTRPPEPPSWPPAVNSRAMTAVEAKPTSARFSEREGPPTAIARPTPLPPSLEAAPAPTRQPAPPSTPPPRKAPPVPEIPAVIGEGDAALAIARAIRSRFTGAVAFENEQGIRRVVLRDGDFVTAASGATSESLVAFLAERGTMTSPIAKSLAHKLPPFGRHAGAALIAHGHLRQDELWPVLRSHAEWLVGAIIGMSSGGASIEHEVPARLEAEPAVFGGATGAEVFVEIVRRIVSPERALALLGGPSRRLVDGPNPGLLGECALSQGELELVKRCRSASVEQALQLGQQRDFVTVLWALALLGVLEVVGPSAGAARETVERPRGLDALDEQALRSRILARKALVDDGDYFALLGVSRSATSYDVERAYAELRKEFEPSRILTSGTADLKADVDLILEVLDEAREILGHPQRRERYRRAVEASPSPR